MIPYVGNSCVNNSSVTTGCQACGFFGNRTQDSLGSAHWAKIKNCDKVMGQNKKQKKGGECPDGLSDDGDDRPSSSSDCCSTERTFTVLN